MPYVRSDSVCCLSHSIQPCPTDYPCCLYPGHHSPHPASHFCTKTQAITFSPPRVAAIALLLPSSQSPLLQELTDILDLPRISLTCHNLAIL
mmetsp:Transcript_46124/g.144677  ORF Transcript_46124/g.144677 Transcript_46124/m.144677 type:complete len:92 (+) Transcript_46124:165-440(+)